MVRRNKKRRGRVRRYVGRKVRRFRSGKSPISILTTLPIVYKALIEPITGDGARWGAAKMYQQSGGNLLDTGLEAANIMSMNFTGFSMKGPDAGTFYPQQLVNTYVPIIVGYLGHKIANRLGVNRQFKKIPFVGKYAQL